METCPNHSCPEFSVPRPHLGRLKEEACHTLAVLPAASTLGTVLWPPVLWAHREHGGFWSQGQASVGFWLHLLRFGLPGQQAEQYRTGQVLQKPHCLAQLRLGRGLAETLGASDYSPGLRLPSSSPWTLQPVSGTLCSPPLLLGGEHVRPERGLERDIRGESRENEGRMEKCGRERGQERQRKFPDTKASQPPAPHCPSKLKEPGPWRSMVPRILSPKSRALPDQGLRAGKDKSADTLVSIGPSSLRVWRSSTSTAVRGLPGRQAAVPKETHQQEWPGWGWGMGGGGGD